MTTEEAIKDIKENIKNCCGGISLDMAIEALEKQIPKKFVYKECDLGIFGKSIHPYCKCGFPLRYRHSDESFIDKYCSNCGQKIDWNDESEEE